MAPKKFNKYFKKLPKEIQCRVYVLSMEPRLIRAKWETRSLHFDTLDDISWAIYRLSCGPVPKILHICKESRYEGLKYYTPIKARGTLHQRDEKRNKKDNEYQIYVNFDIDTIYFSTYPDTGGFLSWIRRVPREQPEKFIKQFGKNGNEIDKKEPGKLNQKPLKGVKHVAFDSDFYVKRHVFQSKLDFCYGMAVTVQGLLTIALVMDNSAFRETAKPHMYSLRPPNLVPRHSYDWDRIIMLLKHVTGKTYSKDELTSSERVPSYRHRKVEALCNGFWEESEKYGDKLGKTFREWRATEQGKAWAPPSFEIKTIASTRRRV